MAQGQTKKFGQQTMTNSDPIVIASDQSTLNTSDFTAQTTLSTISTNIGTHLSSLDTKWPSQGQALAAASIPVVLTAAQLTTLTPPAAITNFALETGGNLASILAGIGTTAGAAVTTDAAGTLQQYLRGQVKIFNDTWDSTNHLFKTGLNFLNGTAIDTSSGNKSTGTLRVVLATDQPALTNKLLVTPDANSQVDVNKIAGTSVVNGGTAGSFSTGGIVANNGVIASAVNPILMGGQAQSSENGVNTTARLTQFVTDLVGKQIVLPYSNPENFISGVITTAMTGTTSTSLVSAPGSALRNYITTIVVSCAHATQGSDINIQDGSGGTTLMVIPAASVYGGAVITLPTPLRQPTTNTALFCANVTTGSSTKVSAFGYKGV